MVGSHKLCYSLFMTKKAKTKKISLLNIELEKEADGRWIAEISKIPGAMAYGKTRQEAVRKASAIALRTLADRVEQGNAPAVISRLLEHAVAYR